MIFNEKDATGTKGKKGSQKERGTKWFVELSRIRNKTAHPERTAVTEEENNWLDNLISWISPNFDKALEDLKHLNPA